MGVAANNEFASTQLVEKGVQILKNTNEFEIILVTWLEKSAVQHTWNAFETHFAQAHKNAKNEGAHNERIRLPSSKHSCRERFS